MASSIHQKAGDHAIQFGQIGHVETISINKSQQATGNGILQLQIGSITGGIVNIAAPEQRQPPTPRSLPIKLAPRAFPLLLGRREEVKIAIDALPYGQSVEFCGANGIGKTVLLRHLAHHPSITPAFPDGLVYHRAARHQSVSDLLQVLFQVFYESPIPFKPTDTEIRQALGDKTALVLLDCAEVKREDVNSLLADLPNCTFIFTASERQLWGEGHSIGLRGLPLHDAVALVGRELGRSLDPEEQLAAEQLCTALAGHPLHILQAAACAREENQSLATLAQKMQAGSANPGQTKSTTATLPKPQRAVLALLGIFAGTALGAEHVVNLTGIPQAKSILETLVRRHLVQVGDNHYSVSGTLPEDVIPEGEATRWINQSVTYFTGWIQQQISPQPLQESADVLLKVLEWAVSEGRWTDVLTLGRSLAGAIALTGQWDTWAQVLEKVLQAARTTGDQAAEAFALHELGTRSLCLGDVSTAHEYLTQALQMRENILHDEVGAAATRHNLEFLLVPPPAAQPTIEPTQIPDVTRELPASKPDRSWLIKLGIPGLLLATGGLLFLVQRCSSPQLPNPNPSPVPTIKSDPGTPELNAFTLDRSQAKLGDRIGGVITLNRPPSQDINIGFKSNDVCASVISPLIVKAEASPTQKISINISPDQVKCPEGKKITITAIYGGKSLKAPIVLTKTPQPAAKLSNFKLASKQAKWGDTIAATVTLDQTPAQPVTIVFASSDKCLSPIPAVPTVIKSGESATKAVKLLIRKTSDQCRSAIPKVEITASYDGKSLSQNLEITQSPAPIPPSPNPKFSFTLSTDQANLGDTVKGTVTLDQAPAQDFPITLTSNSLCAVVNPLQPFQPKGSLSKSVEIAISPDRNSCRAGTKVTISASDREGPPINRPITINSPGPQYCRTQPASSLAQQIQLSLTPQTVGWGKSVAGVVRLRDCVAPKGGIEITLKSVDENGKDAIYFTQNLESLIKIEEGKGTANFSFVTPKRGDNYPDGKAVTIIGLYEGVNVAQGTFQLEPFRSPQPDPPIAPSITSFIFPDRQDKIIYWGSDTVTGKIELSSSAPAGGINILLSSNKYNYFENFPQSIRIEAGQKIGSFTLTTLKVRGAYPEKDVISIDAKIAGGSPKPQSVSVNIDTLD
jgi:hypothetical protein